MDQELSLIHISFRGKLGDRIGYSYTEILDEDAIDMLVNKARENVLAIENEDIQFIYDGDKAVSYTHLVNNRRYDI